MLFITILLAKTSCSSDNGSNINFTSPMKIGQKLHIYSYWLQTLPIYVTEPFYQLPLVASILLRRLQSFSGGFVFFSGGFNPSPVASSPSRRAASPSSPRVASSQWSQKKGCNAVGLGELDVGWVHILKNHNFHFIKGILVFFFMWVGCTF